MKTLRITMTIALAAWLLAGCITDETPLDDPAKLNEDLQGVWNMASVEINGQNVDPLTQTFDGPASVSATMTLSEDFTYFYEEHNAGGTVTWTREGKLALFGNTFALTISKQNGTSLPTELYNGTYELDEDVLTTTTEDIPNTIVTVYTR